MAEGRSGAGRVAYWAVVVVSLLWLETRSLYQGSEVIEGQVESCSGRGDHVFFHHDRPHVVAAHQQARLADPRPLRHPGGLDVGDVIEVDASQGGHFQLFGGVGEAELVYGLGWMGFALDLGQACLARLKWPTGEGGEVASVGVPPLVLEGAVLQSANAV